MSFNLCFMSSLPLLCRFLIISHSELYLLRFVSGKLYDYVMWLQNWLPEFRYLTSVTFCFGLGSLGSSYRPGSSCNWLLFDTRSAKTFHHQAAVVWLCAFACLFVAYALCVNCRIYAPKCHVCHEAIIPSQVIICMDFVLYHLFAAPSKLDDDYTMIVIMRAWR